MYPSTYYSRTLLQGKVALVVGASRGIGAAVARAFAGAGATVVLAAGDNAAIEHLRDLAHGGGTFAQSLAKLGLIDEYRLLVHPVALGGGLPLFSALQKPIDFKLISSTAFGAGAIANVYRPA